MRACRGSATDVATLLVVHQGGYALRLTRLNLLVLPLENITSSDGSYPAAQQCDQGDEQRCRARVAALHLLSPPLDKEARLERTTCQLVCAGERWRTAKASKPRQKDVDKSGVIRRMGVVWSRLRGEE